MELIREFVSQQRVKLALLILVFTLVSAMGIRLGAEYVLGIRIDPDAFALNIGPAFVGFATMLWCGVGFVLFILALRGGFAPARTSKH